MSWGASSRSSSRGEFSKNGGTVSENGKYPVLDFYKGRKLLVQLNIYARDLFELQLLNPKDGRTKARRIYLDSGDYEGNYTFVKKWETDTSNVFDVFVDKEYPNQMVVYIPDGHDNGKKYLLIADFDSKNGKFSENPSVTFLDEVEFFDNRSQLIQKGLVVSERGRANFPDNLYRFDGFDSRGFVFDREVNDNPYDKEAPILDFFKGKKVLIPLDNTGRNFYELQLQNPKDNRTKARHITMSGGYYGDKISSVKEVWGTDTINNFDVYLTLKHQGKMIVRIPAGHPTGLRYLMIWDGSTVNPNFSGSPLVTFIDQPKFYTRSELDSKGFFSTSGREATELPQDLYRFDNFDTAGRVLFVD
ncbi:MAG: hypothetical protein KFW21_04625 [Spirochaetota bacterium]|nr:hypothetical protein [Spirochaetota bacterium]